MKMNGWKYVPLIGMMVFSMTACGMAEKLTKTGSSFGTESVSEQGKGTVSDQEGQEQISETASAGKSEEQTSETVSDQGGEKQTEETAFLQEAETETAAISRAVAIDAGHQGSWVDMSAQEPMAPGSDQMKAKASAGTTGSFSGVPEYELNLQVSLVLRDELEDRGYRVIMAREDNDTAISNKERAELATAENADISVRIHANGSEDASVSGALTMSPSAGNPYLPEGVAEESYRLSEIILEHFCRATGLGNLGVMTTDEMTGINWSTVPITIVEMGFMTNQYDDAYLTDESNHQTMAAAIADGIDAYFESQETVLGGSGASGTNMTALQEQLEENQLNSLTAAGEKWSVAVQQLTGDGTCMIRADEVMQSASVIKAFIMAAVYERAVYAQESGKEMIDMGESYDGELRELLVNMITVSDNESANELVRRLGQGDFAAGAAVINEFCQEHGYTATHMGREFLAESPADDNYTSAGDCCSLLTAIYRGELINEEASGKMLEMLKQQTRTGKIPAGIPAEVPTANKTGEMPAGYGLGTIENDIAIVLDEQNPYVICVLSNDIADNGAAQSVITSISNEVYRYMMENRVS